MAAQPARHAIWQASPVIGDFMYLITNHNVWNRTYFLLGSRPREELDKLVDRINKT